VQTGLVHIHVCAHAHPHTTDTSHVFAQNYLQYFVSKLLFLAPGIGGHPPFAAPVSAPPVSAPSPAASSPRPNVQFFSIGGHAAAPVTGPVAGQPFGPPSTGGFAPPPSSGYGASLPPPPMSGGAPLSCSFSRVQIHLSFLTA
jgi:hypothetical protein